MSIIIRPYRDARLAPAVRHPRRRPANRTGSGRAAGRLSPPGDRRPAGGAVQLYFAGSGAGWPSRWVRCLHKRRAGLAVRRSRLGPPGVGRALVEHALTEMGRPVSIEVLSGNAPALALYEGCGFHRRKNLSGRMPGNEAFPVTVHVLELDRAGLG